MISKTKLQTLFGNVTQNVSQDNLDYGLQLMNFEQKYLLQNYFSNESSYSLITIASQSLTLTATPAIGDISATLTVPWPYYTTIVQVTFSNGSLRNARFQKGSTSITWDAGLTAVATTAITTGGIQTYPLPSNYSKLKTGTLTIGNLKWTPTEILTRQDWDQLNVFPYYADIPSHFFIYNNQFNFWPIPSTTGNVITFNYKRRIPDLSLDDYSTGTVSVTSGGTTVTGIGTSFIPTVNVVSESRWIQFPENSGDDLWYQVASVDSATSITLAAPYMGTSVVAGTYVLGQMPIIMEDFHDMLVWKAASIYFTTTVDNPKKKAEFDALYGSKLAAMEEYAGTKTINVNLSRPSMAMNPNLYWQG